MTDFKIEFEWNDGDPSNEKKRPYPTYTEAESIYHIVDDALTQACRDMRVMLPTCAWMQVVEKCDKCGTKKTEELIQ